MKCSSCGANLQIDNAFCPYCGAPNKVAQKHRDDMKRYESDYKATKEEVIDNSKRFNRKSLKIAAIAVTVAAIAFMIPLLLTMDRFGYSHEKSVGAKRAVEVEDTLIELISADDYLGVTDLINKEHLYFKYDTPMERYSIVKGISDCFSELVRYAYELKEPTSDDKSRYPRLIGEYVNQVYNYAKRMPSAEEDALINTYIEHIKIDTASFLVVYVGISEEDAKALPEMTEAQRSILIEEALANVSE